MLIKWGGKHWAGLLALQLAVGTAVFLATRAHYRDAPTAAPVTARSAPALPASSGDPLLDSMRRLAPESDPRLDAVADDAPALAALGDEYFVGGDYGRAIRVYQRLIQIAPDVADTYNDLGLALHYTGRSVEALEVLRRGSELAPEFQRIWLTQGFVAASTGQAQLAVASLQRARDLGPDNAIGTEAVNLLRQLGQP